MLRLLDWHFTHGKPGSLCSQHEIALKCQSNSLMFFAADNPVSQKHCICTCPSIHRRCTGGGFSAIEFALAGKITLRMYKRVSFYCQFLV